MAAPRTGTRAMTLHGTHLVVALGLLCELGHVNILLFVYLVLLLDLGLVVADLLGVSGHFVFEDLDHLLLRIGLHHLHFGAFEIRIFFKVILKD